MGFRIPNEVAAADGAPDLSFKAYEIEELADVYFFRPAGMVFARAAAWIGMSPIGVTMAGALVGVAGGALLADARWGLAAFALLILHGVLDSSDGQLARMTGRTSELGRLLDGVGGYVTHAAIYVGIVAGALADGRPARIGWYAAAAALANIVHAQMYDYHRSTYAAYAIEGRVPATGRERWRDPFGLLTGYEALQRALGGRHPAVEREMAARAIGRRVSDEDRVRYRACFYWPVRAWNFMGDNTRFYAVGVLAALGRPDLFFLWILVPMNVAFALAWAWQWAADRRFLTRVW